MAKGGSFERELAKKLSLWLSRGEDDSWLWRTSNSGGRATVRGRKGKGTKGHCGDLGACCREAEPFLQLVTIEAKRGYNRCGSIADLLDRNEKVSRGKPHAYELWFAQAEAARRRAGSRYWMLVVRRDQKVDAAFVPGDLGSALIGLGLTEDNSKPHLCFYIPPRKKGGEGINVCGFRLDEFLGLDPGRVVALLDAPED